MGVTVTTVSRPLNIYTYAHFGSLHTLFELLPLLYSTDIWSLADNLLSDKLMSYNEVVFEYLEIIMLSR
jgi:hypothetical protein